MAKSVYISLAALSLLNLNIFAQNKFIFSVAMQGGLTSTAKEYASVTGWNTGLEFEAKKRNIGIYFNSLYSVCPIDYATYEMEFGAPTNKRNLKIFEISIGPRAYIGNDTKFNGSIDAGFGYYGVAYSSRFKNHFGFNVGGSLNYPLAQKIDILSKVRFHINEKFFDSNHLTLTLGLRYSFNK